MPIKIPRPVPPKRVPAEPDPPQVDDEHSLSVRARLRLLEAARGHIRKTEKK